MPRRTVDRLRNSYGTYIGARADQPPLGGVALRSSSKFAGRRLGQRRADFGTYLHGLFHNRPLRRFILEHVAARKGMDLPATRHDIDQNAEFDKLVAVVRSTST